MTTATPEVTAGERIPAEFTPYWDAIERPAVKRARAAARRLLGFDLVPDEDRVLEFAHGYYDADPIAEAFVDEVYLGQSVNEGRRMLDRAIAGGVNAVPDAPASMVRLFEESERDPDWLDPERVQVGAHVFRRLGPSAFSLAGSSTLLAYTENAIVKPLALTGAYAGDTALNVRRRLLQHPEWNLDAWGVPINQSEMTIPLLASSLMTDLPLKAIGHRTTNVEIDAMIHLWRYVGHIMGAEPRHRHAMAQTDPRRSQLPRPTWVHQVLSPTRLLPPLRHAKPVAVGAAPAAPVPRELHRQHARSPQPYECRPPRPLPTLAARELVAQRDGREAIALPGRRVVPALSSGLGVSVWCCHGRGGAVPWSRS